MKQKLKSLRFRMLLPVVGMTLFVVILLTILFTRAYTNMVMQQEQEVNAVGFEAASRSITPLVSTSITETRNIMSDDRVASYAHLQYASAADLIRARISCRDFLQSEIARHDGIWGLLFMRADGSLFGALPDGNIFHDDPAANPLPEKIKTQILDAPLGQTVWTGPLSASVIYGFESAKTAQSVMIAAWKSVDVSYGECYALMLMDGSTFDRLFSSLQDGRSTWRIFTADQVEFCHSGADVSLNPEKLISESNSGTILRDESGRIFCTFSMTMDSPPWTLVREVPMENYEQVSTGVRNTVWIVAGVVFVIALIIYEIWLKKFMRQFRSLLKGIVRMGRGELEPVASKPFSIGEFETMRQEIDRTSLALSEQMDTIRRMERAQMELENEQKEQERIVKELNMAREIQGSTLPNIFPPFPDRTEFSLYASMTPARAVGGDFYDFFLVDSDHLALVIADVSGKGIPAALFMMVCKTLINNQLMTGCSPAEALHRVNQQLCERNSSSMFVTVWLAVLEISTGRCQVCNAGHENPCVRRAGGEYELLKYRHNMCVGISELAKYQNREFLFRPGDSVFVYTDGVPEATAAGNEMFGPDRLLAALNENPDSSPDEALHRMKQAVDAFVGDAEQFDDLTMMCLKYIGPGA